MQLLLTINSWLWGALLVAETLLIIRLMREQLLSRYPIFTIYLTVDLIAGVALFYTGASGPSPAFVTLFQTYNGVIPLLRIGVVCELFERICQHFPGIEGFRLRLAGTLILAGSLLALWSIPSIATRWGFPRQTISLASNQYGSELLAFLLIGMWFFFRLLHITPRYRPNVLIHWRITTLYFLVGAGHAFGFLLGLRSAQVIYPVNTAMLVCDLILVAAWTKCFNRAGEELPGCQFSRLEIEALERKNSELVEFITNLPRQIATGSK